MIGSMSAEKRRTTVSGTGAPGRTCRKSPSLAPSSGMATGV